MPGLLIHGARQVLTLRGANSPRRGTGLRNLAIIEDGSILIEDGKIRDVGPTHRIENLAVARSVRRISARGRVVMPGFVDSHVRLISGLDASTQVRTIRQTPAWRLAADAGAMLRRCLRYGTTTLEVKSGAELDEVCALKVLKVVEGLSKDQPIHLISTFCGATAIPRGQEGEAHVEQLLARLLPLIKAKKLADFVAMNHGVLTEQQCNAVRALAERLGMPVKFHADMPGAGVLPNATTAEHLEHVSREEIIRIADSATVAVLMPGFGFHVENRNYAPARDLIARGVAVALASGYDRGVNPSFSMPITIALACRKLGMAPSEAIVAATLNGAYAVGRGEITGSLEPGKNADILILETSDFRDLAYETGVNPVDITIVGGEVVCRNSVAYGLAAAAAG